MKATISARSEWCPHFILKAATLAALLLLTAGPQRQRAPQAGLL